MLYIATHTTSLKEHQDKNKHHENKTLKEKTVPF